MIHLEATFLTSTQLDRRQLRSGSRLCRRCASIVSIPAAACRCGCSMHGLRSGTAGPCGLVPRPASRLKRRAAAHASPSRKSGALRSISPPETSGALGCIRAVPGRAPPRRSVLLTSSYGGGEGGGGGDGCSCDGCSWSAVPPCPKAKAGHARRSARCFARASRAGTAASSCSTWLGLGLGLGWG